MQCFLIDLISLSLVNTINACYITYIYFSLSLNLWSLLIKMKSSRNYFEIWRNPTHWQLHVTTVAPNTYIFYRDIHRTNHSKPYNNTLGLVRPNREHGNRLVACRICSLSICVAQFFRMNSILFAKPTLMYIDTPAKVLAAIDCSHLKFA